jgi:hypothetical protein
MRRPYQTRPLLSSLPFRQHGDSEQRLRPLLQHLCQASPTTETEGCSLSTGRQTTEAENKDYETSVSSPKRRHALGPHQRLDSLESSAFPSKRRRPLGPRQNLELYGGARQDLRLSPRSPKAQLFSERQDLALSSRSSNAQPSSSRAFLSSRQSFELSDPFSSPRLLGARQCLDFSGYHQGLEISGPPQSLDEAFTSHESPDLSDSHQQRGISTFVRAPRPSPKTSLRSQDPSIVSDSHDEFTAPCRSPNVLPGSDQHLPEILAPHQDIPSNQTNIAEETSRYPPVPHNIASEPWHHPRLTAAQMAKLPPRFQEYVQDGLIVDGSWSQTGLSSALPTKIPCGFGKPFHSECKAAFQSYTTAAAHFPKRVERDCTRMK